MERAQLNCKSPLATVLRLKCVNSLQSRKNSLTIENLERRFEFEKRIDLVTK
jgi:hypothetical protein